MPALLTRGTIAAAALLCVLFAPRRAPAQDAPAGQAPADPRDLNGDGTVTRKEKRQYRRMQRQGRERYQASGDGADAGAAQDAAAADGAASRSQAAMGKAAGAADALKRSLASPDAGGGLQIGRAHV